MSAIMIDIKQYHEANGLRMEEIREYVEDETFYTGAQVAERWRVSEEDIERALRCLALPEQGSLTDGTILFKGQELKFLERKWDLYDAEKVREWIDFNVKLHAEVEDAYPVASMSDGPALGARARYLEERREAFKLATRRLRIVH